MRIYPLLFLILLSELACAQYSAVTLSEKNIRQIADNSKNAFLHVVIDNEKDLCDAALVSAVKSYWKLGTYKFISKTEYLDLKQKDGLLINTFYLHEFYESSSVSSSTNALIASALLKNVHTGVYSLDFIANKEVKPKEKKPPLIKTESLTLNFDLSNSILFNKGKVLDGYYDLMLKYLNNEIQFCQKYVSIKDLKKEDKNGIIYFDNGIKDVLSLDILLIKEQVNKITTEDKKKKKKVVAADAVAQFNEPKNVFTVYPEDIKLAITKADKKVLILSNGMLLSAENGAVVAAPNIYIEGKEKKDGFLLAALSVLILAYAATFMIN
jgi:hypothetical protein